MSSPANNFNQLPSSPSSSSSHQSTSSSTLPSPAAKRKKTNNPFNKNKHDKFLISAEQWTPIVGPSLPKRQKTASPALHENYPTESPYQVNGERLVRLFDPDSTSSPDHQADQPLLVTVETKVSLYVDCFQDMLKTVLEHEQYLFSPSELTLLESWEGLCYASKYLFVRLFMRKHDNWFRLDKLLHYCAEIGELQPACEGLCKSVEELIRAIPVKPPKLNGHEKTPSIPPLEPTLTEDRGVISEIAEFLNDLPQPVLTDSPRSPELPTINWGGHTDRLDAWCISAGTLSNSLDEALEALGFQNWSIPPSAYHLNDFQLIPCLPPIPPAVPIRLPIIIWGPNQSPTSPPAFAQEDPDIEIVPVSTTLKPTQPSPTALQRTPSPPAFHHMDPELASFASMTSDEYGLLNTDELFSCMNLDELKGFAKKLNANPHTTRDMIILGIKTATRKQSTLFGAPPSKGKQKKQLSLKFTPKGLKESQILSLNARILKIVGPCIKLTPKVCSLFKRLHLIFYRSTTISEKTMTPAMLARLNKRSYPEYEVIRTNSIFDSRQTLINYENALAREKEFDDLLVDERKPWNEDEKAKARRQEAKTGRLKKALVLFEDAWLAWQQTVFEEDDRLLQLQSSPNPSEIDVTDRSTYYKRRFHPGWPLTRIMQKGLVILARFKEYEREVHVLEALLQQKHFRRGKRGQWYDRLALVLMTKLSSNKSIEPSPTPLNEHQQSALYTCEQGLLDPDTHQIYRFSLSKRLLKLESILDRHQQQYYGTPNSKKKNKHQQVDRQEEINNSIADLSSMDDWKSSPKISIRRSKLSENNQTGRKTIWKSVLDNSPLTVEEVSLEHYVNDGWRGFHSEGSILKMIFSLVFWNIIFAPIPGAFETLYQLAPLDIATDAFAIVRRPLIEEQIKKIERLGNEEIKARLKESYIRESTRRTISIGISRHYWDRYTLQDLLEIIDCLNPSSFNLISRVFFEDWKIWSAGVPDLCLWKIDQKRCKFVEVKGPGDKLSEQQKNWVNLLLKAVGVEVEICSVKEDE